MAENKILIGNLSYNLTEQDKVEIAEKVIESLNSEAWTFTLEDGSSVTKEVYLK